MNFYQLLSSGSNAKGQLGQNNSEDSNVFKPCYFANKESAVTLVPGELLSVCCGSNHTIVLLRSTLSSRLEIWGCGDSKYAQLQSQSFLNPAFPTHSPVFQRLDNEILLRLRLDQERYEFHAVATSWNTTFIVIRPRNTNTDDGRRSKDILVSFGSNEFGNLGLGRMPHKLQYTFTPTQVRLWEIFDSIYGEEWSGFQILHIAAGVRHIVLVVRLYVGELEVVRILGWGGCRHGQLGKVPECENRILSRPTYLPLNIEIESSALGNQHTVFLDKSGRVHGLGSNRKGQLDGLGNLLNALQIGTTWSGSYVVHASVDSSWQIFSTEHLNNSSCQIVQFPFHTVTRQFVKLVCGSEHVLLHLKENTATSEVWGWGWNEHGNMGLGSTENVDSPVLIYRANEGEQVVNVWAGYSTSWIAVQK